MKQHDNSEAMRLADYARGDEYQRAADDAVDLLRKQLARITELEAERDNLHTTMFAAAVEIQAHWEAHCDAEGYGPANLMHRLERGIASLYGYDAKALQRVEAERDRLRVDAERYQWLRKHSYVEVTCKSSRDPSWTPQQLDTAIDLARTTHKETE